MLSLDYLKLYRSLLVILFCFTFSCKIAFAQELFFNNIGLEEGLTDLSANCLAQDELNRVWIGTRDGLNCFDGTNIKQYKMIKGDTTSVLGQIFYQVKPDANSLWILSQSGISKLDINTGRIKRFYDENILSILPYKGNLLVGKKGYLFWSKSRGA